MFEDEGRWWITGRELVEARSCEWALLTRRAELAGLVSPLEDLDPLRERLIALGLENENRVLELLRRPGRQLPVDDAELDPAALDADTDEVPAVRRGSLAPGPVVSIAPVHGSGLAPWLQAVEDTRAALRAGASVVHGAAVVGESLVDQVDLLCVMEDNGPLASSRWVEVWDVKMGRVVRSSDTLRLGAQVRRLGTLGRPEGERAHVWLGDDRAVSLPTPALTDGVRRLDERVGSLLAGPPNLPVWGDPEVVACGRCVHCRAAVEASRDVFLVAGVGRDQRRALRSAGVTTLEDLAALGQPGAPEVEAVDALEALETLVAQARLQLHQDSTGQVRVEVVGPEGLALLPEPSPHDVFLDFEGDSLYREGGSWDLGIEYLFGTVVHEPGDRRAYHGVWAEDRSEEARALEGFVDDLLARRSRPGPPAHVFHYAPYEVAALRRMARRHGTREQEVEDLVAAGVFVDLYAVVRRSILVSQRSYSIKKLEPLYFSPEARGGTVNDGAASVEAYVRYRALREAGEDAAARAVAADLLAYNRDDCLSTLDLRDWLLSLAGRSPEVSGG